MLKVITFAPKKFFVKNLFLIQKLLCIFIGLTDLRNLLVSCAIPPLKQSFNLPVLLKRNVGNQH